MRPTLARAIPVAARFILFTLLILTGLAAPRRTGAQQVTPDLYAGMKWRSIGPYRSGYLTSVTGVPGDPTVYYIGTPEGGVWKSTNAGTTWKPIFDAMHVASIGAVAVAPSSPSVVYVGTGNQSGWSFTTGNGIYKSTDAGKSWTNIGLHGSQYISSIVVDPRNANVLLVAALGGRQADAANNERGVYRSIDGGRSWTRVLPKDGSAGASELAYDFADPLVVYATLQRGAAGPQAVQPAAPSAAMDVYKSIDGGISWNPVGARGLPEGIRSFGLAVASGTRGRRLYAEVRGGGRGAGAGAPSGPALYRSDDGGASWTLGTHGLASAGGHIYADPKNPDVVYLMGTSMYHSVDGGHVVTSYMGAPSGDDIRNLWIDPTNSRRMIAGADQGPTISVDGGETWTLWDNLPDGQFYRVSTDNDFPYHVCGAQQDSGTACLLSRSDFGQIRPNDWAPVGGFENGFIVTDPLNSRWVYTQGWYHVLRRFDRQTGQVVVLYTPTPEDRFGGAPPLAFSPQDPHLLYMAAQYLMASRDSGQSWRKLGGDLTTPISAANANTAPGGRGGGGATIQALAPSPVAAGEIWVGTSNGLVQLTRDGGATWTNVTPPGMPGGGVNIVDASHTSAGTAYVALLSRDNHPHIYRTSTFGQSWQEITTGIADSAVVRVVREDPRDPNLLYAGTVTSAWVSFDKGDRWQSLQLNLPNTVITDMTVHGNDLVISTYGRGFWILDDLTPLRQVRDAMAATSAAFLFRPDSALRLQWDNTEDTPMQAELPAGQNPPEGVIIDYYLKTPATGGITVSFSDAQGHLIRQFSNVTPPLADSAMPNVPMFWFKPPVVLPTTPGMHRIAWDLRYSEPRALRYTYTGALADYIEYTLNWHSIVGETPRQQPTGPQVIPGTYHVVLTVGGQSYMRDVTITNDPRIPVTQAALVTQLDLQRRMVAGMNVSFDGFTHLQRLRSVLATDIAQAGGKPQATEIIAAAKTLDQAIVTLANAADGGMGPPNRDLSRHLADMEFGDVLPTSNVIAATDAACQSLDRAVASFERLQTTQIAALNLLLAPAQLTALPLWTPPGAPACR